MNKLTNKNLIIFNISLFINW